MSSPEVPAYADLPLHPELSLPCAWDVFGRDDDLGTLNHLTPERVATAAQHVRSGERFGLSLPLREIDPPLFGREPLRHEVFATSRNDWDDKLDNVYPQASSQWDGFLHVRAREHGFYTGVTADPTEAGGRLGMQHWNRGIVGRGVLLDVGTHLGPSFDPLRGDPVPAEVLDEVAAAQGVEVLPGDVLCLRFGWTSAYRALDAQARAAYATATTFSGLMGSGEVAQRIWDWNVAALACDNPAAEVAPGDPKVGSLHRRLLPLLGVPIGELLDFDALAGACRSDNRWTFLLVGVPHNLEGSVASPANAVAIR